MPTVPVTARTVDQSIPLPDAAPLTVPSGKRRVAAAPAPIDIPDDLLDQPRRPAHYAGPELGAVDPATLAPRLPTPLSETWDTSLDLAIDQHSLAVQDALKAEYEAYRTELEELTGERPSFNPWNETPVSVRDERMAMAKAGQPLPTIQDLNLKRWHDEVAAIRQRHPDAPLRSHEDMVARVEQARKATRDARARAEAGETGFTSGAVAFAGGAAGAAIDPLMLATMPFGSPWSAGVLRFALTEAAIGAGTAAVGQAVYQPSRALVGETPDIGEAIENVALAGVGAGVFGGAIRGAPALARGSVRLARSGVRFAKEFRSRRARVEAVESGLADGTIPRTNDIDAALAVERRALDIEEANPVGRDVGGQAIHGQQYQAAERALAAGEVPRPMPREQALTPLPEADRQAVSDLIEMANTDPARFAEAIRTTLRETGVLGRIGIDADRLTPDEAAARLRAITSAPAGGRPRLQSTEAAEPRAEAQRLVTAEEQAAEIDAVREQSVRDLYQGREDSVISIDNEDGTVRNMTVRELFDEFDREADELESLHVCIAGGARKAAAAAAGPLQSVGKAIDTAIQGFFR